MLKRVRRKFQRQVQVVGRFQRYQPLLEIRLVRDLDEVDDFGELVEDVNSYLYAIPATWMDSAHASRGLTNAVERGVSFIDVSLNEP